MHIYNLDKRQLSPTTRQGPLQSQTVGQGPPDNTNGTGLPSYIWVAVAILIALAISCGVCARRTRHRQYLSRQTVRNSHRPTAIARDPYNPPWAAFSRISADLSGLQPPPRARRRGSQASVTSLPVYMENPGAQEVVLLQRTTPKDGGSTVPPTRQPMTGSADANVPANSAIPPSQPIPVSSDPIPPSALATVNSSPPLPGYQHSAVPVPPTPSSPGPRSTTTPPLSNTRPGPQS